MATIKGVRERPTQRIANQVRAALASMESMFVDGARLTFIMRLPGVDGAHMIITADDLGEIEALIRRERTEDPHGDL